MLKTHWKLLSLLHRIGDNFIIILSFLLSYYFRDRLLELLYSFGFQAFYTSLSLAPIDSYLIIIAIAWPLFNVILEMLGAYRSMRLLTAWRIFRMCFYAAVLVFFSLGAVLYFLKLNLSRSFVGIFCGLSGFGLFFERYAILRLLRYFRIRGKNFRNILIVGTGAQARKMFFEIAQQEEFGLRVAGFVDINKDPAYCEVYDLQARIIADLDSFENALKKYAIDEVLFTDIIEAQSAIKELAQIAVEEGVRVTLAADLFSLEIFKSDLSYFGNIPLLHYHPSAGASDSLDHVVKRLIDLVVSFLALIVLSPVLLIIAILIKFSSPGPIFFKQKRVGLNGRTFTLLKFRSMVKDAEGMLKDLLSQNEMKGPVFKIANDPRITPLGRFLRKHSIDELPQLFNVLKGDMSLVGPRPPLPSEVNLYKRKFRKRLSMRPGLTCTWQVSGRNNIPDFEKWAELDLEYINNWSLKRDFELLLRTVPAVLSGSGAK